MVTGQQTKKHRQEAGEETKRGKGKKKKENKPRSRRRKSEVVSLLNKKNGEKERWKNRPAVWNAPGHLRFTLAAFFAASHQSNDLRVEPPLQSRPSLVIHSGISAKGKQANHLGEKFLPTTDRQTDGDQTIHSWDRPNRLQNVFFSIIVLNF